MPALQKNSPRTAIDLQTRDTPQCTHRHNPNFKNRYFKPFSAFKQGVNEILNRRPPQGEYQLENPVTKPNLMTNRSSF